MNHGFTLFGRANIFYFFASFCSCKILFQYLSSCKDSLKQNKHNPYESFILLRLMIDAVFSILQAF